MLSFHIGDHLIPAQVETVVNDDGALVEETKFMPPQAVAVNVAHLRRRLTE
jgi:hypothetical protein